MDGCERDIQRSQDRRLLVSMSYRIQSQTAARSDETRGIGVSIHRYSPRR